MSIYVIDSSVFNKLYLDEPDRLLAQKLMMDAANGSISLLAPDLLFLEVVNTAQRLGVPVDSVVELLDNTRYLMEVRPVTEHERNKALEIIYNGHKKSGYPSIYDAVFHAMAICNDATFITADKRHYEKTKQLGYVALLKDYR